MNINKSTNKWLSEYEANLRQKTNLKSLKLKFNKVFGYYIEIPKSQINCVPEYFERKQTLVNCERYTTLELSEKEISCYACKRKKRRTRISSFF